MVALGRSLSFSRRRNSQKEKPDEPEEPAAPEEASEQSGKKGAVAEPDNPTMMQKIKDGAKIMRSASFGRRSARKSEKESESEKENKKKEHSPTTSDESSDSRPLTPEDEAADKREEKSARALRKEKREKKVDEKPAHEMSDEELAAIPLSNNLQGWLMKRHQKQPHQWGRRFFLVNDERGTIAYSKGEKGKSLKPSVVLSLQDIHSVKLVDLPDAKHPLLISCPPVQLTVSAEDREEALMWAVQLNKRMRVWREKAATKTRVASVNAPTVAAAIAPPMPPMPPQPIPAPSLPPPTNMDAVVSGTVVRDGEEIEPKLQPRDPVGDRRTGSPPGAALRAHEEQAVGKGAPRALVQYPPAMQQFPVGAAVPSEVAGAAEPAAESTREARARLRAAEAAFGAHRAPPSMSPAHEQHVVRTAPPSIGRSPLDTTSVETIDFGDAGSDHGTPTCGVAERSPAMESLDPWAMPTRNLADLLSSDEDEDEDGIAPAAPPAARVRPPAAPPARAVSHSPPPEPHEPPSEEAGPVSWLESIPDAALAEDERAAHAPQRRHAANDWDSEEEEEAAGGEVVVAPPPVPEPAPLPARSSRAERRAARVAAPEPEEGEPAIPELEPEAPAMVGDGIHADSNFIEDNWDSDED